MINFFKTKLFQAIDTLDSLNPGPFEEFTRPLYPPLTKHTLAEKAHLFEDDLVQNFVVNDLVYYEIAQDPRLAWPAGDLALWHGYAVAYSALKYAVTKKQSDFEEKWLMAIHFSLFVSQPDIRLIRGVSPKGDVVYDDASNDSATGILVACYFTMRFGPPEYEESARSILKMFANSLSRHNYALIGADGKSTTYGALIRGLLTDPLRSSLCLAIFFSSGLFMNDLLPYESLLPYAKMKLWWIDSWSDTHRAAAHLAILCEAGIFPEAEKGLVRLWQMVGKSGNTWIACLYHWATHGLTEYDKDNFLKVMQEWDFGAQQFNTARDNTKSPFWPGYKKVLWNGEDMASQPVPVHLKGSDEFRDARNPYSLTSGCTPPSARHHGLGYLLPYWFGRCLGLIREDQ